MEEVQERKKRFVILLEGLLDQSGGVKGKLAEKLQIKPSRLTHWLQGKIDPASLDVSVFIYLAKCKKIPLNSLVELLGITFNVRTNSLDKQFKSLIEQLLFNKTQEELALRLGVKRNTISGWITSTNPIDPANISIATMAAIAFEKGWTIERLFIYLGFKELENEEDLRFKLKSITNNLSLAEQIDLLAWLSTKVGKIVKNPSMILNELNNKKQQPEALLKSKQVCIFLEKEDIALASNYLQNLYINTDVNPKNIEIITISKRSDNLRKFDIFIFDIQTKDSPIIDYIKQISFDGDIVIFTLQELEAEVRSQLKDKVTDIVVKPLDWESLKDKPYFARI